MIILHGKGVYEGIAIGRISFFHHSDLPVSKYPVTNITAECQRFQNALQQAEKELEALQKKVQKEMGSSEAQIFDIHRMMLQDDDYTAWILNGIQSEQINAEYAVSRASEHFSEQFAAMDDTYMQARAADIQDISSRLIRILSKTLPKSTSSLPEKRIICATDLTPSETVQLDRNTVYAFVTAKGSANSHTAILARNMGIPAVVDVGENLMQATDGNMMIVDGLSGTVYLDPDEKTLHNMKLRMQAEQTKNASLQNYKGKETITQDGTEIQLFANIQSLKEADEALENDAGGIGLFRSEFLYLERSDLPSEEEQFRIYQAVLQKMQGKKVVIRTLDIGADKQTSYLGLEREENPAMGLRAIRICLSHPEIFRPQLRALLRASAFGQLAILFPMITSVWEIEETMREVHTVQQELKQNNIPFSSAIEYGIMIETPAAALISDQLAPLVDFFSIGTNDLTQYTLALDRQNRHIEAFLDVHHEAILRLIAMATEQAHLHGKWIGICGELGSDPALLETFLRLGIDELSVSPAYILRLREKIRNIDLRKTKQTP